MMFHNPSEIVFGSDHSQITEMYIYIYIHFILLKTLSPSEIPMDEIIFTPTPQKLKIFTHDSSEMTPRIGSQSHPVDFIDPLEKLIHMCILNGMALSDLLGECHKMPQCCKMPVPQNATDCHKMPQCHTMPQCRKMP